MSESVEIVYRYYFSACANSKRRYLTLRNERWALVELVRNKVASEWKSVLYIIHLKRNLENLDKLIADLVIIIYAAVDQVEAYVKSVSEERTSLARTKRVSMSEIDRAIRKGAVAIRETLKDFKRRVDAIELQVLDLDMMFQRSRSISDSRLVHLDSMLGALRRADDALVALNARCMTRRKLRRVSRTVSRR